MLGCRRPSAFRQRIRQDSPPPLRGGAGTGLAVPGVVPPAIFRCPFGARTCPRITGCTTGVPYDALLRTLLGSSRWGRGTVLAARFAEAESIAEASHHRRPA